MTEAMWVFPGTAKVDVILPDGTHRYWSTHCRHGNHEACASEANFGEAIPTGRSVAIRRKPAQCKEPTCQAPCLCSCHSRELNEGAAA